MLAGRFLPQSSWQTRYLAEHVLRRLSARKTVATGDGRAMEVARFGALGHLAIRIPFQVFEDVQLGRHYPTMVTDGAKVFVNAEFVERLLTERETSPNTDSDLFAALHELGHILLGHLDHRPNGSLSRIESAYVLDAVLNARLVSTFEELNPGPMMRDWVGTRRESAAFFRDLSEADAEASFLADREAFNIAAWGHPEDPPFLSHSLAHLADGAGLDVAFSDLEGFEASPSEHDSQRRMMEGIESEMSREERAGSLSASRSAFDQAARERVMILRKPRLQWRRALREGLVNAVCDRWSLDERQPDPLFFTPPGAMNMQTSPYLPGLAPVGSDEKTILWILDTSKSMTCGIIQAVLSEALNAATLTSGQQLRHLLHMGDTALRGEAIELDLQAVESFRAGRSFEAVGRGGTNIDECLADAGRLYRTEFQENRIAALFYLTDLQDGVPAFAPESLGRTPVTFLGPRGTREAPSAARASRWAGVVEIEDSATLGFG